jgi:Cu-processing system ATP-binding protein
MKQKEQKKTIILTSHLMNEVQELSDEIVFLLEGEIKFKGTIQSLLEDKKETRLERAIAELMSQDNKEIIETITIFLPKRHRVKKKTKNETR